MAHNAVSWFQVTTLLGALSIGCAAHPARPVTGPEMASAKPAVECAGGTISSASTLARFAGCTKVEGDLTIAHSSLRDLGRLRSLERVSGKLTIEGNRHLRDLRGLEGLTSLATLEIRDNAIHSTAGLEGVRSVEHLTVSGNRQLISLAGLNGLERAGTAIVEDNPLLCAQFGLLDALVQVDGRLSLDGNYGLSAREEARLHAQVGRRVPEAHKLGLQEYASLAK